MAESNGQAPEGLRGKAERLYDEHKAAAADLEAAKVARRDAVDDVWIAEHEIAGDLPQLEIAADDALDLQAEPMIAKAANLKEAKAFAQDNLPQLKRVAMADMKAEAATAKARQAVEAATPPVELPAVPVRPPAPAELLTPVDAPTPSPKPVEPAPVQPPVPAEKPDDHQVAA